MDRIQGALSTPLPTKIELPEDVWRVIVKYLPHSQLQRLRSVNRCLLSIAMSARYRRVGLRGVNITRNLWLLHRLQDPYVVHRVRFLTVETELLNCVPLPQLQDTPLSPSAPGAPPVRVPQPAGTTIYRPLSTSFTLRSSQPTFSAELLATMGGLPNVVKYELDSWLSAPQSSRLIYAAAWPSLCQNLRNLAFYTQLEVLRDILTPIPTLPHLEVLTCHLVKAFLETEGSIILKEVLAPFINRHSQSLTSFTFIAYDTLDCTPLFETLHHFPALSELVIRHPFMDMNRTDLSGLHRIFTLHSSHLRELDLSIYFPMAEQSDSVGEQVFSNIPHRQVLFPNLRRLSFKLESRGGRLPSLLPYPALASDDVIDLTLVRHSFSPQGVISLLQSIPRQPSKSDTGHANLKSLTIHIRSLYPSTFDVFAAHLPDLENLGLSFSELSPDPLAGRTDSLLCQMAHKRYPSWRLRRLSLFSTSRETRVTRAHIRAIAKAIPGLETINGKAKAEVEKEVDS